MDEGGVPLLEAFWKGEKKGETSSVTHDAMVPLPHCRDPQFLNSSRGPLGALPMAQPPRFAWLSIPGEPELLLRSPINKPSILAQVGWTCSFRLPYSPTAPTLPTHP